MVCCAALGTLWYAVAVAAVSLTKMYRANQDNKPLPVLLLGVVAASGEFFYLSGPRNLWLLLKQNSSK